MTKREAKPSIAALKDLFAEHPHGLREVVRAVMQEMLKAKMRDALDAGRASAPQPAWATAPAITAAPGYPRVSNLELRVPQDRDGRFSTELFERYQRSERALVATRVARQAT